MFRSDRSPIKTFGDDVPVGGFGDDETVSEFGDGVEGMLCV